MNFEQKAAKEAKAGGWAETWGRRPCHSESREVGEESTRVASFQMEARKAGRSLARRGGTRDDALAVRAGVCTVERGYGSGLRAHGRTTPHPHACLLGFRDGG